MKYYLLNKDDIKKNIYINPQMIKTKSFSKIKRLKTLQKQLEKITNQIKKELSETNHYFNNNEIIDKFLNMDIEQLTEISSKEYNKLKLLFLFDTQEQRINVCNKTSVLKGKLYGTEIK